MKGTIMLFYKFGCILGRALGEKENKAEQNMKVAEQAQAYYLKYDNKARLCYVAIEDKRCTIAGVFSHDALCEKRCCEYVTEFLNDTIGGGTIESVEEITMDDFFKKLRSGEINCLIGRDDYITKPFDIERYNYSFEKEKVHQKLSARLASLIFSFPLNFAATCAYRSAPSASFKEPVKNFL